MVLNGNTLVASSLDCAICFHRQSLSVLSTLGKTPHLRRRNWLDLSKNNRALLFVSWGFYGLLQRNKLETLVQVSNHLYSHPSSSSLSKSQSQYFCPFSLSLHPSLCCNELSIISLLSTLASSAINSLCQMWPHARSDSQEPCSLRRPPSGTSLTHIYIYSVPCLCQIGSRLEIIHGHVHFPQARLHFRLQCLTGEPGNVLWIIKNCRTFMLMTLN